jgi:hypothetical protein
VHSVVCMVQGVGCRVWGAGYRGYRSMVPPPSSTAARTSSMLPAWLRVQGSGSKFQGAGCRVQGAGCRVQSPEFRVQGSGLYRKRVSIKNFDAMKCTARMPEYY